MLLAVTTGGWWGLFPAAAADAFGNAGGNADGLPVVDDVTRLNAAPVRKIVYARSVADLRWAVRAEMAFMH